MSRVAARARARGVSEIRHYTSERGVMGSIMRGRLLSRDRVEGDPDLAFIFEGVWERRDPEWVDHISMSVSQINVDLYQSSRKRFPDYWWAVMAFDVAMLDAPDVVFTTTNNVYDDVCRRAPGIAGFEDMFADEVPFGYHGSVKYRPASRAAHLTTDRAAEVLFPGEVTLDSMQALYVPGRQHKRMVDAWCEVYEHPELPVLIDPSPFN